MNNEEIIMSLIKKEKQLLISYTKTARLKSGRRGIRGEKT
jgi:hypothetical protein